MGHHRPTRLVKICAHCGQGYDAFKAMEARGRFCSPVCLSAERAQRRSASLAVVPGTPPVVISLVPGAAVAAASDVA